MDSGGYPLGFGGGTSKLGESFLDSVTKNLQVAS